MVQLDELKLITAANLINLRTSAGMTQAELGAKINYSDKAISKWERAEAIPDAYVLKQLGEIFGVTVDNLLTSHDEWKPIPTAEEKPEPVYSARIIIAIAIVGVGTMALTAFVAFWLADLIVPQVFVIALPISVLVYLVLICVFHRRKHLQYVIAFFVFSLFLATYLLSYPRYNPWQLFLLLIPAEILVFLSCNIRVKPGKRRRKKEN